MRWLRKRSSVYAGVDFFELQPQHRVEHTEHEENSRVVLLVPRYRSGPLAHWLQPRLRPERAHYKVHLDERGSWLWRQCDGRRIVADIAEAFQKRFPEEKEQVAARVCHYLYGLADNGFISFVNLPGKREPR